MSSWRIPLSDLDYGPEEEAAVLRVLRSKWISMGPEVEAFEREFAGMLGVKHAFAVSNGTAALHLGYAALGLGPGDEVIQPAINFVAAANMTVAVGATPVFADIVGLDDPTIAPEEIERRLTPSTKAVVVMHYGGYLCHMAEIQSICGRHNLALIEDACHAVGARYFDPEERPPHRGFAGALGDIAAFSFFSNKNLATGEGGMVVTNRDDLAERVRVLRSHGMTTLTWDRHRGHASFYDVIAHGYNYRLDELHAALGRVQLSKLQANNRRRQELVEGYRRRLSSLDGWILPFAHWAGESAYHLMVAVAPDGAKRWQAAEALRAAGVQTSLHYPCVTGLSVFGDARVEGTPLSASFAQRVLTLPLYPGMTADSLAYVCDALMAGAK